MNETSLCTLYEIADRRPGWLSKLTAQFRLSDNEVAFLTWLDDQESEIQEKLKRFEKQVERDFGSPDLASFESDEERLAEVNKLIFTIHDSHEEMLRMDKPYLERALFLLNQRHDHWIKSRNKIRARMVHSESPNDHRLTVRQIEDARQYPLEDLVADQMTKSKHILCPFHDDKKASMWVKNGFGWCWSCNAWCDSIRYLMKVRGLSFAETIKELTA